MASFRSEARFSKSIALLWWTRIGGDVGLAAPTYNQGVVHLLRNQYKSPGIVLVAAQVVTGWTPEELEKLCETVRPILHDLYGNSDTRTLVHFHWQRQPGEPPRHIADESFGGLEFRMDEHGSVLWFDLNGVIVNLMGPYPGREKLFENLLHPLEVIEKSGYSYSAKRVSVLVKGNIDPDREEFTIQDYVAPRFEFNGSGLDFFQQFRHEVVIGLREVGPDFQAKVILESATEGRKGIDLTVDVLDHRESAWSAIPDRLRAVKDLESHIFEATITDRTRELYGIYS